ncbi:hypothetical protein FQR65_LT03786 [Abscondita terminalis]|nr:hypothetical protein FQR65_LT03786 [Abscondita terminalis]
MFNQDSTVMNLFVDENIISKINEYPSIVVNASEYIENVRMRRFLIITQIKDTKELFKLMWDYGIPHVVVLYHNKNEELLIHYANPYWLQNECGHAVNEIQSQTCNSDNLIKLPKVIKDYNQCTFLFGWHGFLSMGKRDPLEWFTKVTLTQITTMLNAKLRIVNITVKHIKSIVYIIQSCAKKIMSQIFIKDSTLINLFIGENIFWNVNEYPYIAVNASNKIMGVFENHGTNFIMQANLILILKQLLITLLSRTKEVRMGRFLIITQLKDTRELIWFMWFCGIPHVAVLYYDDTKKNEDLVIHIANPYWTENNCGRTVNKVQLHTCTSNDIISFPKIVQNYNRCTFLFGWNGNIEQFNSSRNRFDIFLKTILTHITRILNANVRVTEEEHGDSIVGHSYYFVTSVFNADTDVSKTKIFFYDDIYWFENIMSSIEEYPSIVVNASKKVKGVFENYETNFVMQANTVLTMNQLLMTLLYDKSRSSENVRMGRFLIITQLKNTKQLFWLMWFYRIPYVAVLYYGDTEKNEDLMIHIANPYWTENKCGHEVNKIELHKCNSDNTITFTKIIQEYLCTFIMGWNGDLKTTNRIQVFTISMVSHIASILHANLSITPLTEEQHKNLSEEYSHYFVPSVFNVEADVSRTKIFFYDDIIWFGTKAEKSIITFFIPFYAETWILIFVVFVLVLIIWWQGLLLQHYSNYKVQMFFQSFSQIGSLLCGVSAPSIPKLVCLKILILFYTFYTIHIQTAYTSDMINNLVVPTYKNVINNVYDLADSDLPIFVAYNLFEQLFYADSENFQLYTKIKKKIIPYKDNKEVQNCNFKKFFVLTQRLIYVLKSTAKLKKLTNKFVSNDATGSLKLSFFVYDNPCMATSINRVITLLQEFGFDRKWYEYYYHLDLANRGQEIYMFSYDTSEYTDWAEPLRLKDFVGVFTVFSVGSLTSMLIFGLEILIKKKSLTIDLCFSN